MKIKTLILGLGIIALSSCDVHTSNNIDVDPTDITMLRIQEQDFVLGLLHQENHLVQMRLG